ncbi:MAG: hypothetical protein R3Y64_09775 [Peptostreptococcaceae bacterium]
MKNFLYNMNKLSKTYIKSENNIDTDMYIGYNEKQIREIKIGILNSLDVSSYLNKDYSYLKMEQIRLSLMDNIDITPYLDEYSEFQIDEIRLGIKSGVDVSLYDKKDIHPLKMKELRCFMLSNNNKDTFLINAKYKKEFIKELGENKITDDFKKKCRESSELFKKEL